MQSIFFRQNADIDIILDGADSRQSAEIKTEDGRKEKHLLYYDGETVSGKVSGGQPIQGDRMTTGRTNQISLP